MSERPRVYLIDAYSNIFRAYYAIRGLSNSKGEATNAVFGFLQMLRKLLRDEDPQYIGIAFDVSSDTVRKEQFEDYKANRKPMPEDLRPQIPWIRRLVAAFKIPLLELPRYEADDVLGTLAHKARDAGFDVVLVSPDKDLFQLVGDGVVVHHTGRDKRYDAAAVEEDFGVPPESVVDVLALMGDASDNVPGVPGIGEKGAKQLVREVGGLDELLERAAEVKRKSYREGLQNHRDQAILSRDLVTIHTDLPVPFEPEELKREEPDYRELLEICWELDFQSVAKEIEASHGVEAEPVPPAEAVTATEWSARTKDLKGEIGLAVVGSEPVGLSVLADDGTLYADFGSDALREAVFDSLRRWSRDEAVALLGHDLKEVLRLLGPDVDVRCRLFDTMLASYLLVPARSHDFDAAVLQHLRRTAIRSEEAGWAKGQKPAPSHPGLLAYAAERAELPRQMAVQLRADLDEQLTRVYETIEEPLVPVLARIEETGVLLDVDFLGEMSSQLEGEVADLEETIYQVAGERFNLNSPQQLGEMMFDKLGYPVLGRTAKTKKYSTGHETLEELAVRGYELPEHVLRYRELTKLKSTYIDALPSMVAADGRLHTRFQQAVAATGRLSSANPNLQNIPIRTELGHRIRKAFRAPTGYRLVTADYSQIELRILAHIAGEKTMIEAFNRGEDIHATTAAVVFGVSPLLVNADQRRMAKVINFGIIYGMSAWGLSRQLGITKKEGERFIAAYLERYPGVERYTRETVETAREELRVETLYGRIRWLPDIKSRNYNLRENAKRMAINARIQGTAADVLKLAMIAVDRRLRRELPEARLLLTVHDELVLEAPAGSADDVGALVREEMTGVAELAVPLVVDVGTGDTWYDAKI